MAEAETKAQAGNSGKAAAAAGASGGGAGSIGTGKPRLRDVWQVPVLALAAIALIGGVLHAFQTKPKEKMDDRFVVAEKLIEESKYREALSHINEKIRPLMGTDKLAPDQRRQFYMMRARSLARGQAEEGLSIAKNHNAIIEEYEAAEREHTELESEDQSWLARSHTALGQLPEALQRIAAITDGAVRRELNKAVVERAMEPKFRNDGLALEVLSNLTQVADASRDDRLWVLTRQTRILVEQGFNDEAITKVLRAMPRLEGADPASVGELLATVAGAYLSEGNVDEARRYLDLAGQMLTDESSTMARVHYMRGLVEQQLGTDPRAALAEFDLVAERFEFSEDVLPSLLGASEVEAQIALSEDAVPEASLARYGTLVERLKAGDQDRRVGADRVITSLMDRNREQYDRGDFPSALAYSQLAESLTNEESVGANVLLAIARAQRALADKVLDTLKEAGILSLAHADPVSQREARDRLILSGEYFRRHATKVVSADARGYADSLWMAADSFDRAGDVDGAVDGFRQFSADLPTDVRNAEAKFRLAQSYQARGDLALAAKIYEELVASRADGQASGPYADASYVPLAQTLLADDVPENDERAERLLQQVIAGSAGGPETVVFRKAVLALGEHYYRTSEKAGNPELAIELLSQFLDRAGAKAGNGAMIGGAGDGDDGGHNEAVDSALGIDAHDIDAAWYGLADCNRLSAAAIQKTLAEAMPEGIRQDRERLRRERLAEASEAFRMVRDRLDKRNRKTALDDLRLRNSYFYIADSAFDLGNFDESIRLYDAARERYSRDPASLVALTQIVAAYLAQGDVDRARSANARAVAFHASLPEAVWDDPTVPMSRLAWARWLDSQAKLGAFGSASGT